MANTKSQNENSNTIAKGLKYCIVTKFVNFNPDKHRPQIIIVNGSPAVRLKGNLYTKM